MQIISNHTKLNGKTMNVLINIDHADLDNCGISSEQFQAAASYALSNLTHPETGNPIYFNNVRVITIADCPEIQSA
jgi:hypothetical protein